MTLARMRQISHPVLPPEQECGFITQYLQVRDDAGWYASETDMGFRFRNYLTQYNAHTYMRRTTTAKQGTMQTALHTCVYMLCPPLFLQISAHIIVRVMCVRLQNLPRGGAMDASSQQSADSSSRWYL